MTVTINRPAPAADGTTDSPKGPDAVTASPRRNGTAGAVWDALTANPGMTTMAIANAAGVSRTSAAKALTAMEAAGQAARTPGNGAGRNKTPETWTAAPATEDTVDNAEDLPPAPEDPADHTALTADEPGLTPVEDTVAEDDFGTGTPSDGSGPVSAVQDAVKILEAEAERRALAEAELHKAQAEEEARRQKIDADLRRARTKEETRRALADLLAAVTTTYAAVISDDDDAVTAGLERINAETAAVRRAAKATAPRLTATTKSVGGDRSAPRPLRPLVEAHLSAYPGKEFTAGEIAKVLDRSPGAVSNALDTLIGQGVAELTCEHPRRFRAAAPCADDDGTDAEAGR